MNSGKRIKMDYKRYITINYPDNETQIQILEYDKSIIIWVNGSPEIFTPKVGRTAKDIVDAFVASLVEKG